MDRRWKIALLIAASLTVPVARTATSKPTANSSRCKSPHDHQVDIEGVQCFEAPNNRQSVRVDHGQIVVRYENREYPMGSMDYGSILWSPGSDGFAIGDSNGSGESDLFSYVDLSGRAPRRTKVLRTSAAKLYAQRFQCPATGSYVYSWVDGWQEKRRIRLIVQEGVHSERCVHSDPAEVEIGVVGDPRTGRIYRVLSQEDVLKEWCSNEQRSKFGYCYEEAKAKPAQSTH